MFADQYAGRRVFVTGHTGFKGFWLVSWLLELGAEITGFSLGIPTTPSAFVETGLEGRIAHREGDVRDRKTLGAALREAAPEIVFHMAAQALVRPSYEDPAQTFDTNAIGTLNLLEAVRSTPSVRAVVCITSDKCYRNDEWVYGYRETDHLGGRDPYSASKACAEIIAHSYFHSFFRNGPAAATVRAGNVIGGGDWAEDRIVPDCARAYAAGEAVRIRSPWATRPWQHVLEPLSGYLWLGARLLQCPEAAGGTGQAEAANPDAACESAAGPDSRFSVPPLHLEAFNFGPAADVNATVAEVADGLAGHWPGFQAAFDRGGHAGKKECTLLKLCCDKALAHLGWRATLDFKETILFTAEWYREYYKPRRRARAGGPEAKDPAGALYALTARQIGAYAAKAAGEGLPWTK